MANPNTSGFDESLGNLNTVEGLERISSLEAMSRAEKPIISKETDPNFHSFEDVQLKAKNELDKKFKSEGEYYYFKDRAGTAAMHDHGWKITTVHNDPRAAEATVLLAKAKGWTSIRVSGHGDFKREVWLKAMSEGLAVQGYEPTSRDWKALEDHLKPNSVSKEVPANGSLPKELDSNPNKPDLLPADRIYEGKILEHGANNYQFNPDNNLSYYAKIEKPDGNHETVWGVDLGRAIQESNIKVGEVAKISYLGNKPVTVEVNDLAANGQIVGRKQIVTNRNTWKVEKNEVTREVAKQLLKGKLIDQKTISRIDKAVQDKQEKLIAEGKKVPGVRVLDKNAPSVKKTRQQNIERERQRERQMNRSR